MCIKYFYMINQKEDKGVWKGKVYSLVPYMVGRLDFCVKVPDFLLQALQESQEAAVCPDSLFACMASVKDMVSIIFYVKAKTKQYELSGMVLRYRYDVWEPDWKGRKLPVDDLYL